MKLARVTKKGNRSFYVEFLMMTLVPLIICGIVMMIVCAKSIEQGMTEEANENLKGIARAVITAYDEAYPGDYSIKADGDNIMLYKGEEVISDKYELLDGIKEGSRLEISIFFYDTRLLTTLSDTDGNRMIRTVASERIVDDVFKNKMTMFYDNVSINGVEYHAYYEPIKSMFSGECLGMIGVAKPVTDLKANINKAVNRNIIVMLMAILITSFFITRFASNLVMIVKYMLDFMKKLSENKLDAKLDARVVQREDELGEMGRNLNNLQISLRRLIERDVLTGLFNRRSAEKRIDEIEDSGVRYCVAIGDIDHFKKFNDTFGHECGDVVLREVAHLLNEGMNKREGFVARWGGEEFLILINDGVDTAIEVAERIRAAIEAYEFNYEGKVLHVTITLGVSGYYSSAKVKTLIEIADKRLYKGKESGRNRVVSS